MHFGGEILLSNLWHLENFQAEVLEVHRVKPLGKKSRKNSSSIQQWPCKTENCSIFYIANTVRN